MQQTGPARDQRMQEEQQQQLVQAQLQLPGTAARVMAVIRGTEESAVCIRQLLNTFSDRLPSEVAFYRKAKLGKLHADSRARGCSDELQQVIKDLFADM